MGTTQKGNDWEILKKFLPVHWEEKAVELGALSRKRKIESSDKLLRVLLIHLADGKSLRSTAAYAHEANICDINDVALLHRLRVSGEWLRWMSVNLLKELKAGELPDKVMRKFRVRLVDGTTVSEQGSTGTDWRIHYCFQLNHFICDSFKITQPKIRESFKQFDISEGDLLIGDRVYCTRQGIKHILTHKGHVLVRFHSTNVPLLNYQRRNFQVLEKLRSLSDGIPGDWDVWFCDPDDGHLIKVRLCSLRKSKEAIEKAKKKIRQEASKKGVKIKDETLEYAEYVTVLTTVNRHALKAEDVLNLYRGRWQIELVFKRLKSIVGLGHLPKKSPESCISWLYGKILVSLLTERLYREADFFSPWGYPI